MTEVLLAVGLREGVRFVSVCQAHAGDYLYAVPCRTAFRLPTWALRIAIQRRCGLAITHAAGTDKGTNGVVLDVLGDVAQSNGREGHAGRHASLLKQLVLCARSVWGQRVKYEPRDNWAYNQGHRPDVATHDVMPGGASHVGDLKLFAPLHHELQVRLVARVHAHQPYGEDKLTLGPDGDIATIVTDGNT